MTAVFTTALLGLLFAGPASANPDSLVAAAERALAEHQPWRATRTIAPLLSAPSTRTPAVLLVAARAAAGWEGWTTVRRLLETRVWLDREADGLGRTLLARASLERGDATAVAHAVLAVRTAPNHTERGHRLVLLARSLERQHALDSAAATWLRAAELLPSVADWLRLRAAGALADSGRRAALYAAVTVPAARDRIRWTEALARERRGDPAGAARLYAELGASLFAARLRLDAARTDADRTAARRELVDLLPRLPLSEVRAAIGLLDRFRPLPVAEELVVGRRAAAAGLTERAHSALARAAEANLLTSQDRLLWGTVLTRMGRHQEAIRQFERVTGAPRAEARYLRARALFRTGPADRGYAALRGVRDSFAEAPATGAAAGWLYADLRVDDGDDGAARAAFRETARRYPTTPHGERAAFQAAMLAWIAGDRRDAAREFDALADREPAGSERTAALYWSGRAWDALGDTARARRRWRTLLEQHPQSYYVVPASRRLGTTPWPSGAGAPAHTPVASPAFARAALLEILSLGVEAGFEYDRFTRDAAGTPASIAAAARAFHQAGHAARALRLTQRAIEQGAGGPEFLPFLYPLLARDVLEAEARAEQLSPFLVAGLIRQESSFDTRARSRADARGLMQVMPATGAQLARAERLPEWDPVLLYQPDVNLHFGLRHLAEAIRKCGGSIPAALAAYNAGSTPVNRWLTRAGTSDPEVFIERIPFVETRDYVRRVLYNEARYAAIYDR